MREWQQMTGFQSPCAEYAEEKLSLDKKFLSNPPAMFIVKAGSSSSHFEIKKGDYLVVDRSLSPKHGDLVIAVIHDEFKVDRFMNQGKTTLGSDELSGDFIWGVISSVHRKLAR